MIRSRSLAWSSRSLCALPNPALCPASLEASVTHRGAFEVPQSRDAFQRTAILSMSCYAIQDCSSNTNSCLHSNFYSAAVARRACASISRMARPFSLIQRCVPSLRPFHQSSRHHQYRYRPESQHNSYRTDSVVLFYRAAQLAFLGTFLAIYLVLQDESHPRSN